MLIIVGPSASGKSAIVGELQKISSLKKIITYTTRSKRWNEVDGVDYYFLSKDEFMKRLAENFFFEYVNYNDNFYGTAKNDIRDDRVVILEPAGLKVYLEKAKDQITIVYIDSSKAIRRARMQERRDDDEVIVKRLSKDKNYFSEDIKHLANLIIVNENKTIHEIALEILDFYHYED